MKKLLLILALLSFSSFALENKHDLVNDFANLLTPNEQAQLRTELDQYHKETGNSFVFISTPSLDGKAIEDWTMAVAEEWKVGKKGENNGLLYVVAPNEHKSRIEVGYGLEGVLPDGKCAGISARGTTFYKSKLWAVGINTVFDGLIAATKAPSELATALPPAGNGLTGQQKVGMLVALLAIVVGLLYWLLKPPKEVNSTLYAGPTPYTPAPYVPYSSPSRSYSSPSPRCEESSKKSSSRSSSSESYSPPSSPSSYDSSPSSSSSSFDSSSSSSFDSGGSFGGGGSSDSW